MSLWFIAWSYLWNRKLTTGLTILSVALAVGLISALLTIRNETRTRFEEEQQEWLAGFPQTVSIHDFDAINITRAGKISASTILS